MAEYFEGERIHPTFTITSRGRTWQCEIREVWRSLDKDVIAMCGGPPVEDEVTVTEGLSRRDFRSLESTLGGSIGSKDVAQFTAGIKSATGTEISWKREETNRRKVQATAPKCGMQRCVTSQLWRTYSWTGERRWFKRLGPIKRVHIDRTQNVLVYHETQEIHPRCNCPPETERTLSDYVDVFIRNLQHILPGSKTGGRVVAKVGSMAIEAPEYGSTEMEVAADDLPAWILPLAGVAEGETVKVTVRLHQHEEYEVPAPVPVRKKVVEPVELPTSVRPGGLRPAGA